MDFDELVSSIIDIKEAVIAEDKDQAIRIINELLKELDSDSVFKN